MRSGTAALKTKAVAAFAIVSVIVLLYIMTSSSSSTETVKEASRKAVDTAGCETSAFTMEQLNAHNQCSIRDIDSNDFWIAVHGYVFDVSQWIEQHPGADAICMAKGDATSIFTRSHPDAEALYKDIMKPKYCIGKLVHGA
jgi:cytochrome b involved in lipid metabolism